MKGQVFPKIFVTSFFILALLIGACFFVCCSAAPSGIDGDSVIGVYGGSDHCCVYDSPGFCGHPGDGGVCPIGNERVKCRGYGTYKVCHNGEEAADCKIAACQSGYEENCL
jgi:hypothetical protein